MWFIWINFILLSITYFLMVVGLCYSRQEIGTDPKIVKSLDTSWGIFRTFVVQVVNFTLYLFLFAMTTLNAFSEYIPYMLGYLTFSYFAALIRNENPDNLWFHVSMFVLGILSLVLYFNLI